MEKRQRPPKGLRRLHFDVEADGLLPEMTVMHCLWIMDDETKQEWSFAHIQPDSLDPPPPGTYPDIETGVRMLQACDECVAHNGIDYDLRAIEQIFPWFKRPKIKDTLIMARVLFPTERLWQLDMKKVMTGRLQQRFARRQSLESWGARLGNFKTDYKAAFVEAYPNLSVNDRFKWWNPVMHAYCQQDVRVQKATWNHLCDVSGWTSENPEWVLPEWWLDVEMEMQEIAVEQEAAGFHFALDKAIALRAKLEQRKAELSASLKEVFGAWWEPLDPVNVGFRSKRTSKTKLKQFPNVTQPRFGKKGNRLKDYVGPPMEHVEEGSHFVRVRWHVFNPSSRNDLAERLVRLYGWEPMQFGDDGRPTLDEGTLKSIPKEVIPDDLRALIAEFFVVDKTLGMLGAGRKAWLAIVGDDGCMHGRIDINGANTGRGIHRDPNMSQVASVVISESKQDDGSVLKEIVKGWLGKFGWECRELFEARPGWEETGTDVSSLELAILGHYLHPHDDGAFAERMSDPKRDPHTEHGTLTGLPRRETKTTTYAYIFGAGPLLVGEGCGYEQEDKAALLASTALAGYLTYLKRRDRGKYVEPTEHMKLCIAKGQIVINKFEGGITGLKHVKNDLRDVAKERGWIRSISGRRIWVHKPHLALNYLLQGGGADVCKLWIVLFHRRMKALGLQRRVDYNQVLWAHDEIQNDHRPAIRETLRQVSLECIEEAGVILGLRTKLRGESKTGRHWAECH